MSSLASKALHLENLRVRDFLPLITPAEIHQRYPISNRAAEIVHQGRETIKAILRGQDRRLLVIVGPCSIHDVTGAMDYAQRLVQLRPKIEDAIYLVMRVYFEKPRTTIGWKGLINDPHINNTTDINSGLEIARKLLLEIAELGLPTATEMLDPIVPQYIADLVCWAAIGARTTESQTHREMASGLSMPVGFKNSTDGSVQNAIDAMVSSRNPHSFLGINEEGRTCIVKTRGNTDTHIILRGGKQGTNYEPSSIHAAQEALRKANLPPTLMIDCSHGNSNKVPVKQQIVWQSILDQRTKGNHEIIGAMIESYIEEGNQPPAPIEKLIYGVSITDPCISWPMTEQMLIEGATILRKAQS
ncbi:MAG: 3-deoxy-7-phosphoheptulonate synthase [Methylacidiphilales bacterium]|nr:3-deoxy-7-phosphoheptulonate synthase [Candidatus Methylacidiphilales bacterium]MDW8349362.1 3-deoxy-7-phosphoheptulonate synthase [Verrucomicrobiae bacterium]